MHSRDRVCAAIHFHAPDRIPLGFSANPPTLSRLYHDFGIADLRHLLQRLHVDIVDLRGVVEPRWRGPMPPERELPGGMTENYWGWRTKRTQTPSGEENCYCDFVLERCDTIEVMARHHWPQLDWFDFSDFIERLEPWHDFAVMASGASVWQHATFLRGLDQLLMDLLAEPELVEFLLDKFTDFYLAYFDRLLTAAHGRIDILRIADDLGMQDRLLMSRELIDQFIAPRLRRLVEMAHSHGVPVMFHSCGAVVPLIDRLIEVGIDILDPVQVTARGMNPELLKENFGSRICFHGSIDTQHLLPHGTPDQVRANVLEMLDILSPGGGFILAPSHILQTDVPTANILALYETAFAYGS